MAQNQHFFVTLDTCSSIYRKFHRSQSILSASFTATVFTFKYLLGLNCPHAGLAFFKTELYEETAIFFSAFNRFYVLNWAAINRSECSSKYLVQSEKLVDSL